MSSVQLTLDDTGNVLTNPQYDAWGNVTSAAIPAPFGFTGEYRDSSSGFNYLRARWYNPATGTLLGRDPFDGYAESPYSQHPFQYGFSDPVSNTDPSGRHPNAPTKEEGRAIHQMIQDDFQDLSLSWGYTYNDIQVEQLIIKGSKTKLLFDLFCSKLRIIGTPTDSFGKGDIFDARLKELYEIKPIRAELTGRAELEWYLHHMQPYREPWIGGTTAHYKRGSKVYPTHYRTIGLWPGFPDYRVVARITSGVIVYWAKKLGEEIGEPLPDPVPETDPDMVPETDPCIDARTPHQGTMIASSPCPGQYDDFLFPPPFGQPLPGMPPVRIPPFRVPMPVFP